jgi:CRISPR-associated protein Cas5t
MAGLTIMRALKIVAEGLVTSFRYPHFVQGVHPTFEMPPPATIYGHVCSAFGEFIPRNSTHFAYHFRFETRFFDYEHLHFFGKEPKMNPFRRELLFNPRLTLYLDNADLLDAFLTPRYPVALGRAQDLMTYTDVRVIDVVEANRAFYTGTLLTLTQAAQIGGRSFAVTMPRFIDENRQPEWGQYAVLPDNATPRIFPDEGSLTFANNALPIWIDSEVPHPYVPDLYRGVIWHEW